MGTSESLTAQRRRFAAAVPTAAFLCLVLGILLLPTFPLTLRQGASGTGFLLAGVVTTVSCGMRASRTEGRRRRSWLLLTLAGVVAVAGNVWVTISGADPVESPSVISSLSIALALLMSIGGLLTFPTVRLRGRDRLLMSLDGLVAGGAMLIILRTAGADRAALGLVAAGFITYAVADLAFAMLAAQERFHFGTLLDLGWIAGYLLIGLAALYPSVESDGAAPRVDAGVSDARGTVMVFGVLLVAAVVQIVFGNGGHLIGAEAGLWLVLILAAGARQMLLASDNAALRQGLERRVREQTDDLRRLARQNEVLLTSVADGIYGVDPDGRLTFINPSGAAALGYTPE